MKGKYETNCIHPGETGLLYNEIGRIAISQASLHGVDADLWAQLRRAVDQLRLVIDLNAVDAARGRAVQILKVGPEGGAWQPASVANPDAIRLAEYLRVHGFQAGAEGPGATLRLGPSHSALNPTANEHTDHLCVSLLPPGSSGERTV